MANIVFVCLRAKGTHELLMEGSNINFVVTSMEDEFGNVMVILCLIFNTEG